MPGTVLGTERREKAVSLPSWSCGLALGTSSLQHCRIPAVPCLHQELFPCKEQGPTRSSSSLRQFTESVWVRLTRMTCRKPSWASCDQKAIRLQLISRVLSGPCDFFHSLSGSRCRPLGGPAPLRAQSPLSHPLSQRGRDFLTLLFIMVKYTQQKIYHF